MTTMRDYLPDVDQQRLEEAFKIQQAYSQGRLTLAQAQSELQERIGHITPQEVALMEQQLKQFDEHECVKEDIQSMIAIYEPILVRELPDLPTEHSLARYYQENAYEKELLKRIEAQISRTFIKNQWLEIYDELKQIKRHLSRKQNQLYAALERKGFDRPTTTMWLLDDFIYDEINELKALLEQDEDEKFLAGQTQLVADMRDLMDKEETILYPTALALLSDEECDALVSGDHEIGYAWITPDMTNHFKASSREGASRVATQNSTSGVLSSGSAAGDFLSDLANLLGKYGAYPASSDGAIDTKTPLPVTTGELTLEQINLIFQHMPVDLSYVDEHELVKFYTDTKHRVFPRSKGVIGRKVQNCHPRTSVHIVEEVIETFRSGKKDRVEFWINKPDMFIYILYVAVRDKQGQFRGVLEMMQDCTHIRALEGSRTLLTWEDEQHTTDIGVSSGPEEATHATPSSPADATQDSSALENSSNDSHTDNTSVETAKQSPHDVGETGSPRDVLSWNAEMKLVAILDEYPQLKDRLPEISPLFSMLKTPLARVMLPKATLGMMAERAGIPVDELVAKMRAYVAE